MRNRKREITAETVYHETNWDGNRHRFSLVQREKHDREFCIICRKSIPLMQKHGGYVIWGVSQLKSGTFMFAGYLCGKCMDVMQGKEETVQLGFGFSGLTEDSATRKGK